MRKINNNTMSFCLVEKNQKILSIITDGDIRRYITQGGSLKDKVLIASNKKFYFLNKEKIIKNNFNIKNYFKNQIKYIPVLDQQKKTF